jgi:hypothetical protein
MARTRLTRQHPQGKRHNNPDSRYSRYEHIKAELTAKATSQAEFEAACKTAARLAGV